jgi:hypothetical protein
MPCERNQAMRLEKSWEVVYGVIGVRQAGSAWKVVLGHNPYRLNQFRKSRQQEDSVGSVHPKTAQMAASACATAIFADAAVASMSAGSDRMPDAEKSCVGGTKNVSHS